MFENYEQRGREFKRLVGIGNGARRHTLGAKREAKT
jgi:hypothetical protein